MQLLNGHIEDTILTLLLREGPTSTAQLLEVVSSKHACTKQGFYQALRKLKNEERVVIYRSEASINELWLRQLRHLVGSHARTSSIIGDFSQLEQGETLSLTLKGLTAMDRLWSHLFSVIEQHVPKKHPLFLFNPHNWSALLREDTDRTHEQSLKQRERSVYLVVGSMSSLDKTVTRQIGFTHLQFSFNSRISAESYVAVIGDYVIDVRFSPKARNAIDALFKSQSEIAAARKILQKMDEGVSSKIVIEKNASKARQWERRIGKDFFIPRHTK